jgi:hypothetical protein
MPTAEASTSEYGADASQDHWASSGASFASNSEPIPQPAFAAFTAAPRSGRWIWIVIAVLLVGVAAAALFGPRFGLKLL